MRVIVTGAAGRLGQALLPALARTPEIREVHALDRTAPTLPAPDASAHCSARVLELSRVEAADLDAADTLIHLAFQLMGGHGGRRRHDRAWVREQNVAVSERVFRTAVAAGVRHLVFLSSAAVYGPWPDSPQPLSEDHPTRPRFPYAEDKVAVEQALLAVGRDHPECRVTILRPPAIVGPHAHPLLQRIARGRLYPAGAEQPVQILWEEDAAAAIVGSVITRAAGVFNLGAEPAWTLRAMARHGRRWGIPVPLGLIRGLHPLAWRLSAGAGDPGWVRGLDGPLVLDCSRARAAFGWTPAVTTAECLERLRR
ncbi:NAD-dependent epimerase/dehydratase family protein [Thioalkalivibrio sp. ALJ16]|uniref:NAD-dependent epimerase/dehydratase family protein n=1 Tax=Thioalkalivibrio sp. ALJ16 TaxID=1158762 RepID=UPI0003780F46|nr:NAD-dependent epimerase/dehydratase family protein [Thioalkalivibrio sp. ALJ16]